MNRSENQAFERITTGIYNDALSAVMPIAREIANAVVEKKEAGETLVLGLATGSTPVLFYKELIRLHKDEGVSFSNVVTFNLDEYFPLESEHPESYHRFMRDQLFDHIDIPESQINIPAGNLGREEVFAACQKYEQAIVDNGGIDIQILGIGRTGHIGFNEPGSGPKSRTRLVTLDHLTRLDAARDFQGEHNVPRYAVTMGVGTILDARKMYLLAWGRSKAEVIRDAVEGEPKESLPASFLQAHGNVHFILDTAAASELTRNRQPWLVEFPEWTERLARKAVTDLSLKLGKPLLKLVDKDYQEHGLSELVTEQGPAYGLNIRIFNEVQHTITGWPGGKPDADDTYRPERAEPAIKRVLVLSPEPLDDILSIAGTLGRLAAHGHDITVAYMTSGSLGVPDEEAGWAARLMKEAGESVLAQEVLDELAKKTDQDQDSAKLRRFKSYIRRNEARASLQCCGVDLSRVKFLDLPFYETGRYRRFQTSVADICHVEALLASIQPHQIYTTGEASDPSSVQAICFNVFKNALQKLKDDGWVKDCFVWLFRSDGREWGIDQIQMSVPCSPDELKSKAQAIHQHRSQRNQMPVIEGEQEETWEQAIDKNRDTARLYDKLGLAEYEAIECFVKWESEEV